MAYKIIIIGNNSNGLYLFRGLLLSELVKKGFEVVVLTPFGKSVSELKELGVRIIETPMSRHGRNLFSEYMLYKMYLRILDSEEPDCVLTYTIKPNIYGGLACAKRGIIHFATITGLGTTIKKNSIVSNLYLGLYKLGIKKSRIVFFQNESNLDFMKSKRAVNDNIVVLPGSGVDLSIHRFEDYPENNGRIVFLIIGRIMIEKGIREVLLASKAIKNLYSNVEFKIIGSNDDDSAYDLVKTFEQEGCVVYLGEQDDVHSFIKDSHATIHASYHEGMSNVLQETAATGRPVIASNIPGCIETFEPYVSGIPFEPKNVEDLVRAIKEFIELPYNKKAEMGIAGRKRMETLFDRKLVVDKYIEAIEKEI